MSDRVKGFVVVLEQDMRDDNMEAVKTVIRMIRGVSFVRVLQPVVQLRTTKQDSSPVETKEE